jgi:hypothetical protein
MREQGRSAGALSLLTWRNAVGLRARTCYHPPSMRVRDLKSKARAIGGGAVTLGLKAAVGVRQTPARLRQAQADHMLRHRPTALRFALAESVDQLRAEHWDALVAGQSICLDRRFLRLLEVEGPARLKMHYALAYEGARPVAAIACQSLAVDASLVPSRKRALGKLDRLRERGLGRLKQRVLVCGNLLGWGWQGVAFAPDTDPESRWHAVAEAVYRIRRQDVLFGQTDLVMVKDVGEGEADADRPLRRYSYRAVPTEPNMVLPLGRWRTFDEYLAALRSEYRSSIKKELRHIEAAGVVAVSLDAAGVRAHGPAIHELYLQVHERQKLRLVTISPGWIPALAGELGAAFRTTILRQGDDERPVGFVTTLKDRDGAIGYYIGFDKALAARGAPLYLRLLYACIEDALALGAAWLSLGRTALGPKASLGAVGQPLTCYVRHRVPALNGIVHALLNAVPRPEQPPARSPFKPGRTTPA